MKVIEIDKIVFTEESIEELKYVSENNAKFPTYSCPYKSDLCYIKQMNKDKRHKKRWICLKCKNSIFDNEKVRNILINEYGILNLKNN